MFVDVNGRRAFFVASADPFGTNPTNTCQLFSIDTLGRRLRQLTDFATLGPSQLGCSPNTLGVGCNIQFPGYQDPVTRTVLFSSSCRPGVPGLFNVGNELFAMRPNGSGLRQLTHTRGRVPGAQVVPGPWAYSAPGRSPP